MRSGMKKYDWHIERERLIPIIVDFTQTDLGGLRKGDWINLEDDFKNVFSFPMSLDQWRFLQLRMKEFIYWIRFGDTTKAEVVDHSMARAARVLDFHDSIAPLAFLFGYHRAHERIRLCPECDIVFYSKDPRQKFCRRRCANLAGTKAWQARQKEQLI